MLFLMRALIYMSQQYAEAMFMHPTFSYTPYAISSREQTVDIITFTQFKEGNLLSETQNLWYGTHDDTENGNKSDGGSTMTPLISE